MAGQKLKIKIVREECIGDGACVDEAPGTFVMDDEGIAVVLDKITDPADTSLKAARACPTDAIVVIDEETGKQLVPA